MVDMTHDLVLYQRVVSAVTSVHTDHIAFLQMLIIPPFFVESVKSSLPW